MWWIFGERMDASDVQFIFGIPRSRFMRRVKAGIPPEEAIERHIRRSEKSDSPRKDFIFRLRYTCGHRSVMELSKLADVSYGAIVDYESGASPWSDRSDDWRESAKRLAAGMGLNPEEVWPKIARCKLPKRRPPDVTDPEQRSVEEVVAWRKLMPLLSKSLDKLNPMERRVIYERFVNNATLQTVADMYGVSRERMRQREAQALGKIRESIQAIFNMGNYLDPVEYPFPPGTPPEFMEPEK
jgi:RNA polymerase sigma factor (sigma-70 family)